MRRLWGRTLINVLRLTLRFESKTKSDFNSRPEYIIDDQLLAHLCLHYRFASFSFLTQTRQQNTRAPSDSTNLFLTYFSHFRDPFVCLCTAHFAACPNFSSDRWNSYFHFSYSRNRNPKTCRERCKRRPHERCKFMFVEQSIVVAVLLASNNTTGSNVLMWWSREARSGSLISLRTSDNGSPPSISTAFANSSRPVSAKEMISLFSGLVCSFTSRREIKVNRIDNGGMKNENWQVRSRSRFACCDESEVKKNSGLCARLPAPKCVLLAAGRNYVAEIKEQKISYLTWFC